MVSAPKPPKTSKETLAAQQRAEDRATAMEQQESAAAAARMRLMSTGGLRLLFSPARREGPNSTALGTTLGTSGGSMQ
jgi:hypothetical protein